MSILSIGFLAFVIAALIIYYLTPGKYQWIVLLAISYAFYMFAGVFAVLFILATTTTTFFAGKHIGKINDEFDVAVASYQGPNPKMTREEKKALKAAEDKRKKVIMVLTLLLNFGILVALKYLNPVVDMMNSLCSLIHLEYQVPHLSVIVPLGISYYTFQAMGYIIDLYRRKYKPESNYGHFMLFVSFFPQLIQGPVSRYNDFMPKLIEPHRFNLTRIRHGAELAMWGLFKKLVIADRIAIITKTIKADPAAYQGWFIIIGAVFGVIQLYADFSGGIDMTRGVAEAFGIIMPENFTRPFFSINFAEFWRRWHITMNEWWRDYLFYPLSLSRPLQRIGKRARKIVGDSFSKRLPIFLSVIIIRVFNAIWHGISAFSIFTGVYYGFILALSLYFEPHIVRWTKKLKINTECASWKIFQCVRTFAVFAAPYLFNGLRDSVRLHTVIQYMFHHNPWILFDGSLYQLGVSERQWHIVLVSLLVLFIISYIQEKGYVVRELIDKQNYVFRGIIYMILIIAIILFGVYGSAYDASAFAYQLI